MDVSPNLAQIWALKCPGCSQEAVSSNGASINDYGWMVTNLLPFCFSFLFQNPIFFSFTHAEEFLLSGSQLWGLTSLQESWEGSCYLHLTGNIITTDNTQSAAREKHLYICTTHSQLSIYQFFFCGKYFHYLQLQFGERFHPNSPALSELHVC